MSIIGERSIPRRFMAPETFLLGTVIYGMLRYTVLIPGANLMDGRYWTVLTLGGVGYRDTSALGAGSEAFSISLVVLLFVSVAMFITVGTQLAASGDLTRRLRRRRVAQGTGCPRRSRHRVRIRRACWTRRGHPAARRGHGGGGGWQRPAP